MTDILADYREWAAAQPTRVSTHSDRCHLWHEQCMIHRLASALERASQNCDTRMRKTTENVSQDI